MYFTSSLQVSIFWPVRRISIKNRCVALLYFFLIYATASIRTKRCQEKRYLNSFFNRNDFYKVVPYFCNAIQQICQTKYRNKYKSTKRKILDTTGLIHLGFYFMYSCFAYSPSYSADVINYMKKVTRVNPTLKFLTILCIRPSINKSFKRNLVVKTC